VGVLPERLKEVIELVAVNGELGDGCLIGPGAVISRVNDALVEGVGFMLGTADDDPSCPRSV
jgi:hypothetical protein